MNTFTSFSGLAFVATAALLLTSGCGKEGRDSEYYDGVTVGSVLPLDDPSRHPHGWGRSDCTLCHIPSKLHRDPNTGQKTKPSSVDDPERCLGCHNPNGLY